MDIRMIVVDLDGTLLRDDKTISNRTINAIKECRTRGIKTVYATGRGGSSKRLAPSELFDGYVRVNGATAHLGDDLIYSRLIEPELIRDFLTAGHSAGIKLAAECCEIHYANYDVSAEWPWIEQYEPTDFKIYNIAADKVFAVVESPDIMEFVNKYMTDDLYLYRSRDDFAMITHKSAVKSKAVAALAERWEIRPHEIAAFGDDSNDIEMLQFCGIGIAMGNAIDEVKAVADCICDTNENDGIAKWLEEMDIIKNKG